MKIKLLLLIGLIYNTNSFVLLSETGLVSEGSYFTTDLLSICQPNNFDIQYKTRVNESQILCDNTNGKIKFLVDVYPKHNEVKEADLPAFARDTFLFYGPYLNFNNKNARVGFDLKTIKVTCNSTNSYWNQKVDLLNKAGKEEETKGNTEQAQQFFQKAFELAFQSHNCFRKYAGHHLNNPCPDFLEFDVDIYNSGKTFMKKSIKLDLTENCDANILGKCSYTENLQGQSFIADGVNGFSNGLEFRLKTASYFGPKSTDECSRTQLEIEIDSTIDFVWHNKDPL